jgi:hypothetical protein
VAKAQRTAFIDAEVISLSTEIAIEPGMTIEDLKRKVLDFERRMFFEETRLDALRPGCSLAFSEVGRSEEVLSHIREHKWFLNLGKAEEMPFPQAATSWYDAVYSPIAAIIRESRLLSRFPGATEADLYVFIGKHWGELNRRYGPLFTLEEAAEDFSARPGIRPRAGILKTISQRLAARFAPGRR